MEKSPKKHKSIFISDVHLGSRGCQAEALCQFLKANPCENLYLVGDIIDGWRLKKKGYWPQTHTNVIRAFLTAAKEGTNVTYIIGNHDEFLRAFLRFRLSFGKIAVKNRAEHVDINGKRYLVVHGDMFDGMMRSNRKWIMHLGDAAYNFLFSVNNKLNRVRRWLGLPYWSLSAALKKNTKRALNFIHDFEEHVAGYCKRKGYDGVICGHIHVAEIREIDGITYMNDGDWVESCTALIEHHDGRWELVEHKPDAIRDSKTPKLVAADGVPAAA